VSANAIDGLLDGHRVLICAGTGGVGKTTCAAALARRAAGRGRRVAVLTIDPARRLADALGVATDDDDARELADSPGSGSLHVYALDSRRTFDRLVDRFAPDAETRERILGNPLYQQIVTSIAGSAEYAAMERVFEISEDERYDLLVVDTPPADHALDFLEAPGRIAGFLESRVVALLVQPTLSVGRFGLRLFEGAARRVLGLLERVSGLDFLEDLSELLIAIESLTEGLHGRAQELGELLRSERCRFLLVTGPTRELVRRGSGFLDQLEDAQVSIGGIIANRVRAWPGEPEELAALCDERGGLQDDVSALAAALAGPNADAAARAAVELASGYASQVMLDRETLAPLELRAQQCGWAFQVLPELPEDVHDLAGLDAVGELLAGS
jgi:anion-transporting  ArsA/GET3 family ATPase